jgi:hypothetical protein
MSFASRHVPVNLQRARGLKRSVFHVQCVLFAPWTRSCVLHAVSADLVWGHLLQTPHALGKILFILFIFFYYFLSMHRNTKPVLGPRIAFYDIASPYQEERNYITFILFYSLSFLTQSSFLYFPFYFLLPVKTPTSGLSAMSHHSTNPCR